jgi:hypothetical protein
MNPYVCTCENYSCDQAQHTVEGVGIVPGRVLSRQVHQEHQRKEAQRLERMRQALREQPQESSAPIQVSCDA